MTALYPTGSWRKTRSLIAHEKRRDPDADVSELKRQLKAEHLADYIEKTVGAAPPLTGEQLDKLAQLLRTGEQVAS